MTDSEAAHDSYHSQLAEDPDLAGLVKLFVDELPGRLDALRQSIAAGDWPAVRRAAHQLRGSGGSHGFPQISLPAGELEDAALAMDRCAVGAALDELGAACSRVRAGVAPGEREA